MSNGECILGNQLNSELFIKHFITTIDLPSANVLRESVSNNTTKIQKEIFNQKLKT